VVSFEAGSQLYDLLLLDFDQLYDLLLLDFDQLYDLLLLDFDQLYDLLLLDFDQLYDLLLLDFDQLYGLLLLDFDGYFFVSYIFYIENFNMIKIKLNLLTHSVPITLVGMIEYLQRMANRGLLTSFNGRSCL
jgi:hypothetical protein